MNLVLDTNIALDLLVFDDPSCMTLRAVIDAGTFEWIATPAMRDELVRVLGYPLIVARLERGGREAEQVGLLIFQLAERAHDRRRRREELCVRESESAGEQCEGILETLRRGARGMQRARHREEKAHLMTAFGILLAWPALWWRRNHAEETSLLEVWRLTPSSISVDQNGDI